MTCVTIFMAMLVMGQDAGRPLQSTTYQDYEAEFSSVLGRLKLDAPGVDVQFGMLTDAAQQLAERLPPEAIPVLKGQIHSKRRAAPMLAALTLAKMHRKEAAVSALRSLTSQMSPTGRHVAITAIGYLPAQKLRKTSAQLVVEAQEGEIRAQFLELLSIVGDRDSLRVLEEIRGKDENRYVQAALKHGVPLLKYKLQLKDKGEKSEWERKALTYWRIKRDPCLHRNRRVCIVQYAERIAEQEGKLPLPFLMNRFRAGDPVAAELIGMQKETAAIIDLKPHVGDETEIGSLARHTLGLIGSVEACRALESALVAGHVDVNRQLARALAVCGDEQTAKLLSKLSRDSRYDARARAEFGKAVETIRQRLNVHN